MAIGGIGGSGGTRRKPPGMPPLVSLPQAPNLGNYSREAVARAVAKKSAPAAPPRIRAAVSQPTSVPKPPPVVVANNQGNYSRPKPPPPVAPGNIQGGGGGIRGNNNTPKPAPRPVKPAVTTPSTAAPAPVGVPAPSQPAIQPAAVPPELEAYLGTDTDYQGQLGQFGSALTDYQAQIEQQKQQGASSFAQRLRELQQAQLADESDVQEDFASRGLLNSGVYADALSQLQQQYLGSQTNLQSEQTGYESSLQQQLLDFQAQQQAALEQAKMEAIARRAAQYGL